MKILVVDDDQRIRDALEIGLQLQWQDAKVLTAADGEAGLDLFFNEEPDIVLLGTRDSGQEKEEKGEMSSAESSCEPAPAEAAEEIAW